MKANESALVRATRLHKTLVRRSATGDDWFAYRPDRVASRYYGDWGDTPLQAITNHFKRLADAKSKQA